jgi:hypothetical protein
VPLSISLSGKGAGSPGKVSGRFRSGYIMSLKTPEQVRDMAAALTGITEADFRRRFDAFDAKSYGFPLSEEDFRYTWNWFQGGRALYTRLMAGRDD